MNDIETYFYTKSERIIYKWNTYFESYEKYFMKYRGRKINVLEIGVFDGGSLRMWADYFGNKALIVGMDINKNCASLAELPQIEIFIGDQSDPVKLKELVDKYGGFDIIIDDGSHINSHQIKTFQYLFDYLREGGTYLVEDVHTSYQKEFGGGYKNPNSFMEFSKDLLDGLHRQTDACTKYMNTISTQSYASDVSFLHTQPLLFCKQYHMEYIAKSSSQKIPFHDRNECLISCSCTSCKHQSAYAIHPTNPWKTP